MVNVTAVAWAPLSGVNNRCIRAKLMHRFEILVFGCVSPGLSGFRVDVVGEEERPAPGL